MRFDQPFAEPASDLRTKQRCNAKKTNIGNAMAMNAAAVNRCQPLPSDVTVGYSGGVDVETCGDAAG